MNQFSDNLFNWEDTLYKPIQNVDFDYVGVFEDYLSQEKQSEISGKSDSLDTKDSPEEQLFIQEEYIKALQGTVQKRPVFTYGDEETVHKNQKKIKKKNTKILTKEERKANIEKVKAKRQIPIKQAPSSAKEIVENDPIYKNLPEQEKKQTIRMIRNRISAQNSRDRKKVQSLQINIENEQLKLENENLRSYIQELHQIIQNLNDQIEKQRCQEPAPDIQQNTTQFISQEQVNFFDEDDYSQIRLSRANSFSKFGLFGSLAAICFLAIVSFSSFSVHDNTALVLVKKSSREIVPTNQYFPNFANVIANSQSTCSTSTDYIPKRVSKSIEQKNYIQNLPLAAKQRTEFQKTLNENINLIDPCLNIHKYSYSNALTSDNQVYKNKSEQNTLQKYNLNINNKYTSTVYCPSGIILDEQNGASLLRSDFQNKNGKIQRLDWIQLILSKKNLTSLIQLQQKDLHMNYVFPSGNDRIFDENALIEIQCQVFNVKEIK